MRWLATIESRCCSKVAILSTRILPLLWRKRCLAATEKILVIKLGALGDIVQAMGAAKAIRDFHRGAAIVLLTTRPYADFLRRAPYFDEVWIDERPGWGDPPGLWRLARRL